jgi:hypothetical protein
MTAALHWDRGPLPASPSRGRRAVVAGGKEATTPRGPHRRADCGRAACARGQGPAYWQGTSGALTSFPVTLTQYEPELTQYEPEQAPEAYRFKRTA